MGFENCADNSKIRCFRSTCFLVFPRVLVLVFSQHLNHEFLVFGVFLTPVLGVEPITPESGVLGKLFFYSVVALKWCEHTRASTQHGVTPQAMQLVHFRKELAPSSPSGVVKCPYDRVVPDGPTPKRRRLSFCFSNGEPRHDQT